MQSFNNLECHFTWNIRSVVGGKDVTDKLSEKNEEIAGQPWRNILIGATLAYELQLKNDSSALVKLTETIQMWECSEDDFTVRYKDAIGHVLFSLKAFFLKDKASKSVMLEIFKHLCSYSSLPFEQKAAILAIKAHVFSEYGMEGTKHALVLAREAKSKNPEEYEWSFMVSKMLSRIRHFTLDFCVTEEELEGFRHAYTMGKLANHAVFLAHAYLCISKTLYRKLPDAKAGKKLMNNFEGRIIEKYNKNACELFREALEKNDNACVHITVRCAKGFLNLPGVYRDIPKALKLIDIALEKAPANVYVNSMAAVMYYRIKEYDKAFKFAKTAQKGGSYGASVNIFHWNIELNKEFDAEETFTEMFKIHYERIYQLSICLEAIAYYILKNINLTLALKYFFKASDLDATTDDFNFFIYWIREQIDLCYLIYNEVSCELDKYPSKREVSDEKLLHRAVGIINTKYQYVTKKNLQPFLVKYLIDKSKQFTMNFKPRNRMDNKSKKFKKSNKSNNESKEKVLTNHTFKKGRKQRFRKIYETGSDSDCSCSSNSSLSSTGSFTRIRRNSKEAAVLNIVSKDEQLRNFSKVINQSIDSAEICTERKQSVEKSGSKWGWGSKGCGSNLGQKYSKNNDQQTSPMNKMFSSLQIDDKKSNDSTNKYNKNSDSSSKNPLSDNEVPSKQPNNFRHGSYKTFNFKESEPKNNSQKDFRKQSSYKEGSTSKNYRNSLPQDFQKLSVNQQNNSLDFHQWRRSEGSSGTYKNRRNNSSERSSTGSFNRYQRNSSEDRTDTYNNRHSLGSFYNRQSNTSDGSGRSFYTRQRYPSEGSAGSFYNRQRNSSEGSAGSYNNNRQDFTGNRKKNDLNKLNNKKLIRKPFNLAAGDSLDSDDSVF